MTARALEKQVMDLPPRSRIRIAEKIIECVEDFTSKEIEAAWSEEIVAMWRFTRNNGITEGFHNKMELINRQAYAFATSRITGLGSRCYVLRTQFGIGVCPHCWRRAA